MPIISAPGAAGTSGANTLLSTTTLGADGTFDISAISQAFNDLLLTVIVRGTRASSADVLVIRFNNDSAANYDAQLVEGANATALAGRFAATASPEITDGIPAATAPAGYFGVSQILIPGYTSTTWQKICLATWSASGAAGAPVNGAQTVQWHSTAAISRIQLFGGTTANLLAGSTVRIYGVL